MCWCFISTYGCGKRQSTAGELTWAPTARKQQSQGSNEQLCDDKASALSLLLLGKLLTACQHHPPYNSFKNKNPTLALDTSSSQESQTIAFQFPMETLPHLVLKNGTRFQDDDTLLSIKTVNTQVLWPSSLFSGVHPTDIFISKTTDVHPKDN